MRIEYNRKKIYLRKCYAIRAFADYRLLQDHLKAAAPPFQVPKGNEQAVWIKPDLVCVVEYMEKLENGSLRQPVYRGIRTDKQPQDCTVNQNG